VAIRASAAKATAIMWVVSLEERYKPGGPSVPAATIHVIFSSVS
jgi:hypothetical protein